MHFHDPLGRAISVWQVDVDLSVIIMNRGLIESFYEIDMHVMGTKTITQLIVCFGLDWGSCLFGCFEV